MPIDTKDPTAALSDLSTDLTDIIKGYEVMEDRGDADLQPIARRFHALHEAHAAELLNALETMGGHPEDAGSMMGAVQTAVVHARDWIDKLDLSALSGLIDGEERLLDTYDDVIATVGADHMAHDLLVSQRDTLRNHVEALKAD